MLDAMLSNRQSGMHIRRIAPGSVTERESTRLVLCEDEQVANALRLIKARATSGLTASDVASEATICRRALEMRFRQFRKHTIWEEITFEKLEQACLLLNHSNATISQISEQCGFGSVHRFYSLFKRAYEMTPNQYRSKKQRF